MTSLAFIFNFFASSPTVMFSVMLIFSGIETRFCSLLLFFLMTIFFSISSFSFLFNLKKAFSFSFSLSFSFSIPLLFLTT